MRRWLAISVLLAATTSGCASAIASALGASGTSARAAADLDAAMLNAALQTASAGGERAPRPAPPRTTFGGEPSYVCTIPGDPEEQVLAASSLDSAINTCSAMNEIPDYGECDCREAEVGSALPEPIAER